MVCMFNHNFFFYKMEPKYEVRKSLERVENYLREIIAEYESVLFHINNKQVNIKEEIIINMLSSFQIKKTNIENLRRSYSEEIQNSCKHEVKEDWFDIGDQKEIFLKCCANCDAILE